MRTQADIRLASQTGSNQCPSLKQPGLVVSFISFLLLFSTFALSPTAFAEEKGIMIVRVSDYQQDNTLLLDSESLFHLPEQVKQAIHHEIPLNFKTEIRLLEETRWMGMTFQRTRFDLEYYTRLYAYGVNHHYVLYNTRNNKVQTFETLESALQTLGTLRAFPIAHLAELHPEQRYTLEMKISLDRWKLPAPLIIESFMDPDWHLESDWFESIIETPKSWL